MRENLERPDLGGEVPHYQVWEVIMNDKATEERGVKSPDGTVYYFENGEKFAQITDEETGERRATIIDKNGNEIPFDNWVKKQVADWTQELGESKKE